MAIDRTGISSLDTGASDITYSGDEGPKSPDQQLMASADPMLVEEYNKYVFEMEEQGLQPISFREFVEQIMSESKMAEGGIARLGYQQGQLVQPGPGRPGYRGDAARRSAARMAGERQNLSRNQGPPGGGSGGQGGAMHYQAPTVTAVDRHPETYPLDLPPQLGGKSTEEQAAAILATQPSQQGDGIPGIIKKKIVSPTQKILHGVFPGNLKNERKYIAYLKAQGLKVPSWLEMYDDEDKEKMSFEDFQKLAWDYKPEFIKPSGTTFVPNMLGMGDEPTVSLGGGDPSKVSPYTMDFKNYLLTHEKNPNLISGGDLSHFYKMENPEGAINPETGMPFTNTEWNKFRGEVVTDRGLSTGGDDQPEWMRLGFSSYAAYLRWLESQGGGGGTTTPEDEEEEEEEEEGQQASAGPLSYHIPGAANFYSNLPSALPTGQTTGVTFDDPTEMLRYYSADGGRVPAAYGGIMDSATGRRRYGLGSMLKKIIKSPIGKAAIIAGLGYFAPTMFGGSAMKGASMGAKGNWWKNLLVGSKASAAHHSAGLDTTGLLGKMFLKKGAPSWSMANISPWKSMLWPSLLGGAYTKLKGDKDEMPEWLKRWYAEKAAADEQFAGISDPANLQPITFGADGGRIGYADGGNDEEDLYLDYIARRNQEGLKYGPSRGEYESYINAPISMGQVMPEGGLDEIRRRRAEQGPGKFAVPAAQGGRIGYKKGGDHTDRQRALNMLSGIRSNAQEGGLMDLGGMEKDYRNDGGFVPIGGQERADDVPARLSKNEFVFTADAVRAAGGGDIDAGAEVMENVMENLERGGQVSEESQGLEGARDMFATAKRLEGVL